MSFLKKFMSQVGFSSVVATIGATGMSLASHAQAETLPLADFTQGRALSEHPWKLGVNEGTAQFNLVKDEDKPSTALQLHSDVASFNFSRKFGINLKKTPILTWDWKVTQLPTGGHFADSDTDDQAAQLLVAFSYSRVIAYIWDTGASAGMVQEAPSYGGKTIVAFVLQGGSEKLGQWVTESRNLAEDYREAFPGEEVPNVTSAIRIQINSQHTRSQATSLWRTISATSTPLTAR